MLLHLQIRNFAIIPTLEQDFLSGFTAISGETGAGKSILVDALSLLLGARSDSSWVMAGQQRAELNAEFSVSGNTDALSWLEQQELENGDTVLLRRSIQASGRSRGWINGTPVTIQQLGELGHLLVEVHGQNEHVRLTGARRQLELLDRSGNHQAELDAVSEAYAHWEELSRQFDEQAQASALSPNELEFLRYQHAELNEQAVSPEDLSGLEQEHELLARSGDLLKALDETRLALDDEDHGAVHRLGLALARLEEFRGLDPSMEDAARMLDEALILVRESENTLQGASDKVDLSPERLDALNRQLSQLNDLARKHGVDMADLATVREDLGDRLENAEGFEARREALQKDVDAALDSYRNAARSLSKARHDAGTQLAGEVEALLNDLGMAGGRFVVELTHDVHSRPSELGDDRAEILVSANPGMPPAPLSKVASGGELSRIGLAIKVAGLGGGGLTHVFDEVDAGVGGDTANAVGGLLKKVSRGGQALCVTHLAQVAVRADQHLLVSKQSTDQATEVDARVLNESERVDEVARMLGGSITDQSRSHASELLESAA